MQYERSLVAQCQWQVHRQHGRWRWSGPILDPPPPGDEAAGNTTHSSQADAPQDEIKDTVTVQVSPYNDYLVLTF